MVVFTMWFSAGMVPLYLNYVNMGVANRWGIIVAFGVQAFNIILLRSFFEAIPERDSRKRHALMAPMNSRC